MLQLQALAAATRAGNPMPSSVPQFLRLQSMERLGVEGEVAEQGPKEGTGSWTGFWQDTGTAALPIAAFWVGIAASLPPPSGHRIRPPV